MTTEITNYNNQMPTLPSDAPMGYEGVDTKQLPIPRIKLMQGKSKSVEDGTFKEGSLVNSLTGEVYPDGEQFVFIKYSKGAIYFDKETEKLVCKSNNGEANTDGEECASCPHRVYYKTWTNNKPNKCVETANLLAIRRSSILTDSPDVAVVTFKSSSFSAGMNVVASAALKKKPLYLWAYHLNTVKKAKYKNAFVYAPLSTGYVTNEELSKLIGLANRFADQTIEVDASSDDHQAEESGAPVDAF